MSSILLICLRLIRLACEKGRISLETFISIIIFGFLCLHNWGSARLDFNFDIDIWHLPLILFNLVNKLWASIV